ncbi:HNH endonuclease [Thermoleptolyngbya sichuanensis]|uniref:HNH endonuclease n=1 Tax=Thermoleptolyngbya sichuanensis TaxID=2885951 RepID=UPI001E37AB5A
MLTTPLSQQCNHCGAGPHQAKLTIDHIIPLAQGGVNDLSNLQVLCRRCNSSKQHGFDTKRDCHFNRTFGSQHHQR